MYILTLQVNSSHQLLPILRNISISCVLEKVYMLTLELIEVYGVIFKIAFSLRVSELIRVRLF